MQSITPCPQTRRRFALEDPLHHALLDGRKRDLVAGRLCLATDL